MNIGFSTLALFLKNNNEIIQTAKKHDFSMVEILAEEPFYKRDNKEFKDCGLDIRIHSPTVDINIASINTGIRKESIRQMIHCAKYAEMINAKTITVHPGKIGRIDKHLRIRALELCIESIGEIIDNSNVEISVENMPNKKSFLATNLEEMEMIQNETNCHLTIDTGHANTSDNLEELLNMKNISYCHLHDNNGIKDQHITLGEGTLNLELLKKVDNGIIEINNFNSVLKSKEVIHSMI
ncbi:MAG: sugar phosphate isomerase/epimerase [Methanosphaera stadtmanae]|nr:sugar phosphate isomerase/epimerase [Methanosphaera stadtmanae]